LKRKIIHTYELESEYGWFTGVLLQGKKRAQQSNDLAIINREIWNTKGLLDPTQNFLQELA
jgi:hypothetical protein